jgi:membrane protein DedA with SNARE-associated domain
MRWSRFLVANAFGGVLWSGVYAFGAYALGNAVSSIGSTITIAGLVAAGVPTAATIVIGRRSLRRIEQRAEDAFPGQPAPSPAPAGRAA